MIALRAGGVAALARGGRLWNLPWLPAMMEDLTLRLESRPFGRAAFPQVFHNALDSASLRPQPLGKRRTFSTATPASTTTTATATTATTASPADGRPRTDPRRGGPGPPRFSCDMAKIIRVSVVLGPG